MPIFPPFPRPGIPGCGSGAARPVRPFAPTPRRMLVAFSLMLFAAPAWFGLTTHAPALHELVGLSVLSPSGGGGGGTSGAAHTSDLAAWGAHDAASDATHGGDCQALGRLPRPFWAQPADMRRALGRFASVYARRPFRTNAGGMRFDHSFALWYVLRRLEAVPSAVVESGAFRGHSTWVMRQALPAHVPIFSLSPEGPARRLPNVRYLTGRNFVDFAAANWTRLGVDAGSALVLLDDHQSSYRRIFREGARAGFRRFVVDDNYAFLHGDNLSLKWVCERARRAQWPGWVRDNFGKQVTAQSWAQHVAQGEEMRARVRHYYEFPPVAGSALTLQTRYNETDATPALIVDKAVFDGVRGKEVLGEFHWYTHICYVEIE